MHKIMRYRIHAADLEKAVAAIETLVEEIANHEPDVHYQVYRVVGEPAFVHIMEFPDEDAEHAHQQAAYTKAFAEQIYPCWETPPELMALEPQCGSC